MPSTSVLTAYDLTVGVIVDMDEMIYTLSPSDSPMITGVDSDGLSVLGARPATQTRIDFLEEEILVPNSTLAKLVVTADAEIVVAAGHQLRFSTGDVLVLGNQKETVQVTGYSATTADTLLATRSFGTAAATTHATSDTVTSVGTVLAEGSNPENTRALDRTSDYNLTQIFGPTAVSMSGTEQVVKKYGVSNEFTHQIFRTGQAHTIQREQALLYGERVENTSAKKRQAGGMNYYITTNVATTTALNVTSLQALQQLTYNNGGNPDRLATNPIDLSDLNTISDNNRVRQTQVDTRRGRMPVTVVDTEFGTVTIVRNRWIHSSDAFLFGRENCIRRVLRPLQLERLAKTGDSDKVQIVCEETLEVKGEAHCGKFNALSYS